MSICNFGYFHLSYCHVNMDRLSLALELVCDYVNNENKVLKRKLHCSKKLNKRLNKANKKLRRDVKSLTHHIDFRSVDLDALRYALNTVLSLQEQLEELNDYIIYLERQLRSLLLN